MRSTNVRSELVDIIIEHYQRHHRRCQPGAKERKLISARIRDGYSVDDLCEAIDGCHASPFHMGDNERHTKYLSLGLIMRDSDHVQQFIEIQESKRTTKKVRRSRALVEGDISHEWRGRDYSEQEFTMELAKRLNAQP